MVGRSYMYIIYIITCVQCGKNAFGKSDSSAVVAAAVTRKMKREIERD